MNPPVYEYDDYRSYATDWLAKRPSLSQRWLAQRLQVSASMVSMILAGQRDTTLDKTPLWCEALDLEGEDAAYFTALLYVEHHPDHTIRRDARRRIQAGKDFYRARTMSAEVRWLGSWLHLALLEAARCPGFDGSAPTLAERLWPPVSVEDVATALGELQSSGSLRETSSGWEVDMAPLRTAMRIHDTEAAEQAHTLHRTELEHALRALEELPGGERAVASVIFSTPKNNASKVLGEASQMLIELATAHGGDEPGEVMQVVIAAFPHTRSPPE